MAPKSKKKNSKKNSMPSTPKENGDLDPLSSLAPGTPGEELNTDFSTPNEQPDTPNDSSEAMKSNGILGANSIFGALKTARDKAQSVLTGEPESFTGEPESTEPNGEANGEVKLAEGAQAEPVDGDDLKAWGVDGGEKEEAPQPQPTEAVDEKAAASADSGPSPDERAALKQMEEMNKHIAGPTEAATEPASTGEALSEMPEPVETLPHGEGTEDASALTQPLAVKEPAQHDAAPATEEAPIAEVVPAVVTAEELAPTDVDTTSLGAVPAEDSAEKAIEPEILSHAEAPTAAEEAAVAENATTVEEATTAEPVVHDAVAEAEVAETATTAEEATAAEPVVHDAVAEAAVAEAATTVEEATAAEPVVHDAAAEAQPAAEPNTTEEPAATAERAISPPPAEPVAAYQHTPIEAPPPPTLESLISRDPNFSASRYLSTHSTTFTSRPHHEIDVGFDLDSRNMASSLTNWYNKLFAFAEQVQWRDGWHRVEEFDMLTSSMDNAFTQISMFSVDEFLARKPRTESGEDAALEPQDEKYEKFWEWKSRLALAGFCANYACREIFGKSLFGLDDSAVKALGSAMFVFAKDLGDEITATRFRHMTTKLLFESQSFKKSTQKYITNLSSELAIALSPLASLLPHLSSATISPEATPTPSQPQPTLAALIESAVIKPTVVFHNTVQKDQVYFALFHPIPSQEFIPEMMEEVTLDGMGEGKGAVAFVVQPGLVRLGFPKYGESHDIGVVSKARVIREGGIEFDG